MAVGGTIAVVRRALAVALLSVVSISLIPPEVFASEADSNLPTCCRRNGKHHCGMVAESSSDPAVQSSPCANFPSTRVVPLSPHKRLPMLSHVVVAAVSTYPTSRPRQEVLLHISFTRAGQKRGPPVIFS
jgi:hypothetical protein